MALRRASLAQGKPYFDRVDPKVDFPAEERKLLKHWHGKGIVGKYLKRNENSKKYFSFLDGPITANNPMGIHHAWGRTYKDLWQRFRNMQGYKQRFQNGFDCQGLWVEVEVEKELGFKSKKDIEAYGVAKFVQKCRERVLKFSKIQTEQSKRLGYFMDWDHSYYTMSDENNYMIWHFLKTCFNAGWIYKGADSVPWCPRCETAISQHEMLTEDYKESAHESVYLAFPVVGADEHFLVWTTTPWTIPANIAIAVDENLEYCLVEVEGKKYWLAKEAVARIFGKTKVKEIKTTKGSRLVGLKYKGAFDDLPKVAAVGKKYKDKFHNVVATDSMILPVTTTEGTGLVHIAVSAGTEDFHLGKKLGLPMIPVIKDDASYLEGLGFLSGQNAKDNPRLILDYLKALEKEAKHFFWKIENYTHRYPACWRCKTELVWKVTDEWYIAMDKPKDERTLRQRMVEVAKKINWIPGFGLDRELDWLANMHDWLISKKNRFWGLALPIWECKKCGHFEVIGGKEELKERAVSGWKGFEGKTPHKPQIDEIKIKCANCGEESSRIEPVGNPWLDAGIVAFSTISRDNAPAPLYLEARREWEKWFPADFITESFPGQFKNWFYALIAMATVLEDTNPFKTVLGFGTLLGEDGRPMHKSWGNAVEFNEGADKIGVDVMRWMYVRQNPADNLLFGYHTADETRRRFHLKLWNIYNYLVTYANVDGWKPSKVSSIKYQVSSNVLDKWLISRLNGTVKEVTESLGKYDAYNASFAIEKFVDDFSLWYVRRSRGRTDRRDFYTTTYFALTNLSKLLAPFNPFIAEIIYKNLTKEDSVHLADWPKADPGKIDASLEEEMVKIRNVVEVAHGLRKEAKIPVRQALGLYATTNAKPKKRGLEELLKDEINVLEIKWGAKKDKLDTVLTPKLKAMGEAREVIRMIQDERKKMGVTLNALVEVSLLSWPEEFTEEIKIKARVKSLTKGKFRVK